ncbi:unnamed protein product [Calicophoron daubneyi]|uniref:GPI inositol-deacylase n=1 Tax=Calicophoron daubneyi TaxID=300641 RepID=A0AAV2TAX1_CALDB
MRLSKDRLLLLTVYVTVSLLLVVSILDLRTVEQDRCKMSYMIYQPFLKMVPIPPSDDRLLNAYSVYYYCSGICHNLSSENAFPVLFLPGTGGSFKMVRSLASAQDYFESKFYFEFFAVDYAEESSGLNGELLDRQSAYLSRAIDGVLNLYRGFEHRPSSVIVVAHSMGGIVALNLLADAGFDRTKIRTLIFLSCPLLDPVLSFGPKMESIYRRVNFFLNDVAQDLSSPLVLVSLTGGSRDLLVADILGNVGFRRNGLNALWLSTSAVSRVWASCDHLSAVWCRQLMNSLTKLLFSMKAASPAVDQLDTPTRREIIRKLLITQPLPLTNSSPVVSFCDTKPGTLITKFPYMPWVFLTGQSRAYYAHSLGADGLFIKLGPFFRDPRERVFIMANQVQSNWIFLCSETGSDSVPLHDRDSCTYLTHLTDGISYTTWMPPSKSIFARGAAILSLPDVQCKPSPPLEGYFTGFPENGSYIVIANPAPVDDASEVEVIVETFSDPSDRIQIFSPDVLPWYPFSNTLYLTLNRTYHQYTSSAGHNEPFGSALHRVYFSKDRFLFSPSLPSPRLSVSVTCSQLMENHGMLTFSCPWDNHFSHVMIEPDRSTLFDIDVLSAPTGEIDEHDSLLVDFYLKPQCNYTVSVHYSLSHWIAKLLRLHWSHLFGLFSAHLVLEVILAASMIPSISVLAETLHSVQRARTRYIWRSFGQQKPSIRSMRFTHPADDSPSKSVTNHSIDHRASFEEARDDRPSYLWSFGFHIAIALFHFATFQLFTYPPSDWVRIQRYGQLGLRYAESTMPVGSRVPTRELVIAYFPLLIITLLAAVVSPLLLDFLGFLVFRSAIWTIKVSQSYYRWEYRHPQNGRTRTRAITLSFALLFGAFVCEALGTLILAGYLIFRTTILLAAGGFSSPSSHTKTKSFENGYCLSDGVDHPKAVAKLIPRKMSLSKTRQGGISSRELLLRAPLYQSNWPQLITLVALTAASWHIKPCPRCMAGSENHGGGFTDVRPKRSFLPLISFLLSFCLFICVTLLLYSVLSVSWIVFFTACGIELVLLVVCCHSFSPDCNARMCCNGGKPKIV